MQQVREIPWFRVGAESAAIVVSILLAFAIDAWWADATSRRTQSEELTRLYEELVRTQADLNSQAGGHEQIHAAVTELFERVQGHRGRDEPLVVQNSLLIEATRSVTVDLAMPVLDGLILSGAVDSIQSQVVISAIAGWRRALGELDEIEQTARQLDLSYLIPSFVERANMGDVLSQKNREGTTAVLIDDELEGHLGLRYNATRLIVNRVDQVEVSLMAVIGAIEQAEGL